MAQVRSFEDLECWKAGKELRIFVSQITKTFPAGEKYALISQMNRAARPVTNNIAEGYGRFHFQENIQFCRQSRGSLTELLDDLLIAHEENYISDEVLKEGRALVSKCLATLNGYINYLTEAKGRYSKVETVQTTTNR